MLACTFIKWILVEDDLKLIKVNWNRILSDNNPRIVLNSFNLAKPLMLTYFRCRISLSWIRVENLLEKISAVIADELRYCVISVQDFLV